MSSESGNLVKADNSSENKACIDKKTDSAQCESSSHHEIPLDSTDSVNSLETANQIVSDTIVSQVNKLIISEELCTLSETQTSIDTQFKSGDTDSSHIEDVINANKEDKTVKNIEETNSNKHVKGLNNIHAGDKDGTACSNMDITACDNEVEATKFASKSAVILNKKSEALRNLLVYDSEDSSTNDSGSDHEDQTDECDTNWQCRREPKTVDTGTSDSESDSTIEDSSEEEESDEESSDVFDCSDSDDSVKIINTTVLKNQAPTPIAKEEDLLPPVPDLSGLCIDIQKEEFLHMGHVAAIIDKLVTVEALPGVPAYDLDSCLFVEEKNIKKPLGVIYDVLGPVTSPLYCIRFNTVKDIENLALVKGTKVFVAPKSEYSKYVFVSELMKIKGTDASWLNDQERPGEFQDFSDDEQEREVKSGAKRSNLKRRHGSIERHQEYERSMNQSNMINTEIRRMMDGSQPVNSLRNRRTRPESPHPSRQSQGPSTANDLWTPVVAAFDPSVPPPGFNPQTTPSVPHPSVPMVGTTQFDHSWGYPTYRPFIPLRRRGSNGVNNRIYSPRPPSNNF